MSSITATRTTRFTPPAEPTRRATPRRTVDERGSSVVGRAGRPVLRIVADGDRAPVFTRMAPLTDPSSTVDAITSVEPCSLVESTPWVEPPSWVEPSSWVERSSWVEPASWVEPSSLVEPVETPQRRVNLDDFFVADYDGDDQRVEVAPVRRSTVRLTRRGRLLVLGLGLAAALGLGLYAASVSTASDHPEPTRTITVQPGQTLWDISSRAAAATDSGDVRSMMSHVEAINHLDSGSLQVGQHLRVPR
jgi:hypothetical protein